MVKLIFPEEKVRQLETADGLRALSEEYSFSFSYEGNGIRVCLQDVPGNALSVEYRDDRAEFAFDFTSRNHFFRCLGLLLEKLGAEKGPFRLEETAYFRHNGPLLDMSQGNAVINLPTMKRLLRQMAMMGLNQCILYMEDSFDVPEEPYFGYMRSRYSFEELKELDDYGYALGIEMIPAVQSLAHFEDVLKWDVYLELRESVECLIPEQEATYRFLRHLFAAASRPFRTKRISLCMDEAHGLGLGAYLKRHGLVNPAVIVRRHLEKVLEIMREMGLRPMIADDMFHRPFGSKKKADTVIPQDFIDAMPKGFDILCWDYYMTDPKKINALLERDRKLSDHVVFEGGIWTWVSYAPHWDKTRITTDTALGICKEQGIDDIHATVWGDTGTECDIRMILWGLQLFAEHGFMRSAPSEAHLRSRFRFCTGGDYDLFFRTQDFDKTPGIPEDVFMSHSSVAERMPSKLLMWQDPLYGLFDKNIEGLALNDHYARLEKAFTDTDAGAYSSVFELYRLLARVLAIKSEIGIRIHQAYFADDRVELAHLANETLPELLHRVQALQKQHARCWLETCKPIGWEVIDLRYGGLRVRIENAMDALNAFLDGTRERLEEVEQPQLLYNGELGIPKYTNGFGRIYSASRIANAVHLGMPKK